MAYAYRIAIASTAAELVSNSVSVPVDNLIFSAGAFGFMLPWGVVWQIFLFNLIGKYANTVLSLPLIYFVPEKFGPE